MVAAAAVAWARVFFGVHYPMDMAGGVLVSLSSLAFVHPLWKRVQAPVLALLQSLYRRLFAGSIAKGWIRS